VAEKSSRGRHGLPPRGRGGAAAARKQFHEYRLMKRAARVLIDERRPLLGADP